MKGFTLDILQTLHEEKKKRNIFPDHVTRNDVLVFIKNKVERSLRTLEKEGTVKSGEMMNYDNRYYEFTKQN